MPKLKKRNQGNAEVGERIRARRLIMELSQETLAAKVGISFQQVQKYENGSNGLSVARLKMMAAALHVSPMYFIAGDTEVEQDNIRLVLTPGARKMLAAFNRIENSKARERLIVLVESFAEAPKKRQ